MFIPQFTKIIVTFVPQTFNMKLQKRIGDKVVLVSFHVYNK